MNTVLLKTLWKRVEKVAVLLFINYISFLMDILWASFSTLGVLFFFKVMNMVCIFYCS